MDVIWGGNGNYESKIDDVKTFDGVRNAFLAYVIEIVRANEVSDGSKMSTSFDLHVIWVEADDSKIKSIIHEALPGYKCSISWSEWGEYPDRMSISKIRRP